MGLDMGVAGAARQAEIQRSDCELSSARGELARAQEDASRASSASEDCLNVAMGRVHVLEVPLPRRSAWKSQF